MRTKKIRLGIVMAAISAVVGGSALGVAQSAVALAGTDLTSSPAAADTSSVQAPASESFAAAAIYDWN
jgi:hypothetical protein